MSDPSRTISRPEAVSRPVYPTLLLVLACAFWGGNVVAGRALSIAGPDQVSPAVLNALRWSIALLALAPVAIARLRTEWGVVRASAVKLLVLGTLGVAGYYLLFYNAVETVPAIEAGLLVGAMPAVIVGLALALRSETASRSRLIGLALALLGSLATVTSHAGLVARVQPSSGDALIVAAILCWSVYTVLLQRWRLPISTVTLTFSTAVAGLLVTLLAVAYEIAVGTAMVPGTGHSMLLVLYVGLFPAIGSTLCWNEAVRLLGASTPAVFMTLIPVFSTGFAVTLLGEGIGPFDVLCLALVVGGVALAVKRPASRS